MSSKITTLTKVINGLKDNHPDLPYNLLPQLNIKLDSGCLDKSDDIKDLKEAVKLLKFPILDPIKSVIDKMIEEKNKLPKANARIEKLVQILESEKKNDEVEFTETTPGTSTEKSKKNKKKKNSCEKPAKKIKVFDANDLIASQEAHLIFNNSVKWWRPFNILEDGRFDPLCFDHKECKKETNQWNHEKEIACKQVMKSRCGFRMNVYAFVKLTELMKELNANFWPIPKCSCTKDKPSAKNRICVRGSTPQVENFRLWYFCEDCRTTFYFCDLDKKIRNILKSQPQLIAEEEEAESEDESGDDHDDESEED